MYFCPTHNTYNDYWCGTYCPVGSCAGAKSAATPGVSPRDLAVDALKLLLTDDDPRVRMSAAQTLLDYKIT